MKIFKKINNFINDNEFKITYILNQINISFFIEITEFSSTKIKIKNKNGYLNIIGKNLVISKMEESEILINGNIKSLEFEVIS